MKTSELTGMALDWVVTLIEQPEACAYGVADWRENRTRTVKNGEYLYRWHQSWAQGGPIIEREKIKVAPNLNGTWLGQIRHEKDHPRVAQKVLAGWTNQHGPSPLVASMRCYVSSKLGDEIEIPKELL